MKHRIPIILPSGLALCGLAFLLWATWGLYLQEAARDQQEPRLQEQRLRLKEAKQAQAQWLRSQEAKGNPTRLPAREIALVLESTEARHPTSNGITLELALSRGVDHPYAKTLIDQLQKNRSRLEDCKEELTFDHGTKEMLYLSPSLKKSFRESSLGHTPCLQERIKELAPKPKGRLLVQYELKSLTSLEEIAPCRAATLPYLIPSARPLPKYIAAIEHYRAAWLDFCENPKNLHKVYEESLRLETLLKDMPLTDPLEGLSLQMRQRLQVHEVVDLLLASYERLFYRAIPAFQFQIKQEHFLFYQPRVKGEDFLKAAHFAGDEDRRFFKLFEQAQFPLEDFNHEYWPEHCLEVSPESWSDLFHTLEPAKSFRHAIYADKIEEFLGVFEAILAKNQTCMCRPERHRKALQQLTEQLAKRPAFAELAEGIAANLKGPNRLKPEGDLCN